MKMVSVIIPVYNRQDVLNECINSVLSQSYQNFEIILIDDGSSDKTIDICKEYASNDKRIRFFAIEHAGVSAARNLGIENSDGEYVFFLDSDDVIHPLLLETLVSGIESSGADIAATGIVNVSDKYWYKVEEIIQKDKVPGEVVSVNFEEALHDFFSSISPINLIGGVMMRRTLIGETRFRTDLFIGEDYYFVYQNLIKKVNSVFLKQKWYYCRIHANNSSNNYGFDAFWSRFYRRELVWKSEELFGRSEYVDVQKRDACGVFFRSLSNNDWRSEETKKICKVLKKYRKGLSSSLSIKANIGLFIYIYFPFTYAARIKLKRALKRK